MKKLIGLLLLVALFSCEKSIYDCYICKTYLGSEELFTVVVCGMTEENISDFRMGMEIEAQCIIGMDAKVECKIK